LRNNRTLLSTGSDMKIIPIAVLLMIVLLSNVCYSQGGRIDPKKLLGQIGNTAEAFLLTANRPTYTVSSDMLDKGSSEIDFDVSFNNNTSEVPLLYNYGLSHRVQLFAGFDLYNQTYRFNGNKISGIGDANAGLKYMFQESDKFSHVFQLLFKIPTASSDTRLGTGYVDYHLGLVEGFEDKLFSYDFSLELNFLHKASIPYAKNPDKILTQALLDTLRTQYQYSFEQELIVGFTPSFDISSKVYLYTGYTFDRNMRLDYNQSLILVGLGYTPTDKFSISGGVSDGLQTGGNWLLTISTSFGFK